MATTARRGRLGFYAVGAAIIMLSFAAREELYWLVVSRRVARIDGYDSLHRWRGRDLLHGPRVVYHHNGFVFYRCEFHHGQCLRQTVWSLGGQVIRQEYRESAQDDWKKNESPPWWWSASDQARPRAPRRRSAGAET